MKEKDLQTHLNPSLYRILCLDRNATPEMIKSNYRGLSKTEHPDVSKEPKDVAHEKFTKIGFAYTVLSNPDYKAKYDMIYDQHEALKKAAVKRKVQGSLKRKFAEKKKQQVKPIFKKKTDEELRKDGWQIILEGLRDLTKQVKEQNEKREKKYGM